MGTPGPDINEPTAHLSIDFQEQADIYEAFFQIAVEDDRIAGFISWNYAYFDDFFYWPGPSNEDMRFTSSIRNKLAEAVTYKWAYTFQTLGIDDTNLVIPNIPQQFRLYPNYPNPFNNATTIHYEITRRTQVTIVIYDLLGKKVSEIENGTKEAGSHRIQWNGWDDSGRPVSAGIYFYRIQADQFVQTKKMVLLK